MHEPEEYCIPSEGIFPYLPGKLLTFSSNILSWKSLYEQEDDSRCDEEQHCHGGDRNANDQGFRYQFLTVFTPVPPVLTHPTSVKKEPHPKMKPLL